MKKEEKRREKNHFPFVFFSFKSSEKQNKKPASESPKMTPRVLYWGSGSAPAWRVMITLAEKKLVRDQKAMA